MKKSICLILLMGVLLLASTGCRIVFNDEALDGLNFDLDGSNEDAKSVDGSKEFSEDYNNQEELAIDLNLSVSKFNLNVDGSTDQLVETEATYNYEHLEPEFKLTGESKVKYTIKQENLHHSNFNSKSEINTKINSNVITDIDLGMGVGEVNLDLTDIKIRDLDVECGVGDLEVIASGTYEEEQSYEIAGGVGNVELTMDGIYNKAVTFTAQSGVGDIEIDCTGEFKDGASISIEGGVGSVSLDLPENMGIKINTSGLNNATVRDNDKRINLGLFEGSYTNELYSEDQPYIIVDIEQGVGSVNIDIK